MHSVGLQHRSTGGTELFTYCFLDILLIHLSAIFSMQKRLVSMASVICCHKEWQMIIRHSTSKSNVNMKQSGGRSHHQSLPISAVIVFCVLHQLTIMSPVSNCTRLFDPQNESDKICRKAQMKHTKNVHSSSLHPNDISRNYSRLQVCWLYKWLDKYIFYFYTLKAVIFIRLNFYVHLERISLIINHGYSIQIYDNLYLIGPNTYINYRIDSG